MRSLAGHSSRLAFVNVLTLSRLPAGILIGVVFSAQHKRSFLLILIIYLLLTDLSDGALARRWSVATLAGAILDYVVDRFNYYLAIFLLIHSGVSPFLLIPFLLRDLAYVSVQIYIGMPSIRGTKAIGFIGTAAVYLYLLALKYWNARGLILDLVLLLALSASLISLVLRIFHLRYRLLEELKRDLLL
jgi:phosphatidylglycerophosphate synthase